MKLTDKDHLQAWREFCDNMDRATPIDQNETQQGKLKRIKRLEADDEAWFKYYFPNFYTSEPADFHKKSTRRVMTKDELYIVRSWSRELSKSGRTMMEVLKLCLTGKKKTVLLASASYDSAVNLLLPYKGILESNNRIIQDYGVQKRPGSWSDGKFVTRKGVSFRALGKGQSPRGARNNEARPDVILIDDIDTDEEVRNPDLIKEAIKWIEQALIPTRSVSKGLLIIACGNIIAKECCITAMGAKADYWEVVNIRDKNDKSSWPQKNAEADIQRIENMISYESFQKEYMNNPMDGGDTFKELTFEQLPQMRHCDFVVIYADPATSNREVSKASSKAIVIVSNKGFRFHVHKAWVDQMSNATFCEILFVAYELCKKAGVDTPFLFIENNTLQDPFYEQVLLPHIYRISNERNVSLPITPDTRKKPDKFVRIEGTLEPKNRLGNLVFNASEKDNPGMQKLEAQFLSFSRKAKLMDGPDAVEGAVKVIEDKVVSQANDSIETFKRKPTSKRF